MGDSIRELYYNVFLPPQCPSGETDETSWTSACLGQLCSSLRSFMQLTDDHHHQRIGQAISALESLQESMESSGVISETKLSEILFRGSTICLYIKAQNAGIIIQPLEPNVIIEAFELSPTNSAVYGTTGRLQRHFPSETVAVPEDSFGEFDFISELSATLATMSRQSCLEMQPRTKKATTEHIEERDTVDPRMVTSFVMAIMQGIGGRKVALRGIWKNTREEVLWSEGNKLPWRRSPIWLLCRVSLQLLLSDVKDNVPQDGLYKRFMIFFMTRILEISLGNNPDPERLLVMNAKLARRLIKLDIKQKEPWMTATEEMMQEARRLIEEDWSKKLKKAEVHSKIAVDHGLGIDASIQAGFPKLDRFIHGVSLRESTSFRDFIPQTPRIVNFDRNVLPTLDIFNGNPDYDVYNLASFETWVADHLEDWRKNRQDNTDTCICLKKLMADYHSIATQVYGGQPEGQSAMFLTLLELWIACDKAAIQEIRLMSEYKPEVPLQVWSALLLRSHKDMQRLHRAETYLRSRNRCGHVAASILTEFGSQLSFATRYASSSEPHQKLRQRILDTAKRDRENKKREFAGLKHQYHSLIRESEALGHSEISVTDQYGDPVSSHFANCCEKCKLVDIANGLIIRPHEWPLPRDENMIFSVVFELSVPACYGAWRDCTMFFLSDVLGFTKERPQPTYSLWLNSYECLRPFFTCHAAQYRITVLSEAKAQLSTHYKDKCIVESEERDVCVETGAIWRPFDKQCGWLGPLDPSEHISDVCTFVVPGKADVLQDFVSKPWSCPEGRPPNEVISRQSECPAYFSLSEYRAYCNLGLGCRIQWLNILRQLAMPFIDWNKYETFILVWQLANQAGPSSDDYRRCCHRPIGGSPFVTACIKELRESLGRVRKSWESCPSLGVFAIIATKLASLCPDENIDSCLEFLADCRNVCHEWQLHLRHKSSETQSSSKIDFTQKALEAASICLTTFDVSEELLEALLSKDENLTILLSAMMGLRECTGPSSHVTDVQRQLMLRCHCLIQSCHGHIVNRIDADQSPSLDRAIKYGWSTFKRDLSKKWKLLDTVWLRTKHRLGHNSSTAVHFNTITGELLVNGLPRSRLPADYESHATYSALFGDQCIEATPSVEPGMQLAAVNLMHGYELHFDLSEAATLSTVYQPTGAGKDLLVRAKRDESTWELLPKHVFEDLLPHRLVKDFMHWYNLETSQIHFRPLSKVWDDRSAEWKMLKLDTMWELRHHQGASLLFPCTEIAAGYERIFEPLEETHGLHITVEKVSSRIDIHIPRLQLDFFTEKGSDGIKSRQYKDMVVDSSQAIETLIGLKSKLVLRHSESVSSQRIILVPEGLPEISAGPRQHVSVSIHRNTEHYQAYTLNNYLGQLEGNGSMRSRLFLAELHAITSGLIADPFTKRTGTEVALTILTSAAALSAPLLSTDEINILKRVAALSPQRVFYPLHLRQMQTVAWRDSMSSLVQHDRYAVVVKSLLQNIGRTAFLHQDAPPQVLIGAVETDSSLRNRAIGRRSMLDNYSFKMLDPSPMGDAVYKRDHPDDRQRLTLTIQICMLMRTTDECLLADPTVFFEGREYYDILSNGTTKTLGPTAFQSELLLRYDAEWLQSAVQLARKFWCHIHVRLAKADHGYSNCQLMLWLATMAFAKNANPLLLHAFIAFARIPRVQQIKPPERNLFDLSQGYIYIASVIQSLIENARVDIKHSPYYHLQRDYNETNKAFHKRREKLFLIKFRSEAKIFEREIHMQWPCYVPQTPSSGDGYIRKTEVMEATRQFVQSWYDNWLFYSYLDEVCEALRKANKRTIGIELQSVDYSTNPIRRRSGTVSMSELLQQISPPSKLKSPCSPDLVHLIVPAERWSNENCQSLVDSLRVLTTSRHEERYLDALDASITSLAGRDKQSELRFTEEKIRETIQSSYKEVHAAHERRFHRLCRSLERHTCNTLCVEDDSASMQMDSASMQMAAIAHQWPQVSPILLLSQLGYIQWANIAEPWRQELVNFAISLSDLQTVDRLRSATSDLMRELGDSRPRTWDPLEFPDTILLEIESNIRIRSVQDEIAAVMRQPPSGQNAVMQLNMGEGKSSVIVPMIAASLANGEQLVRVIVAKPQSKQMQDMLVSKLGGLIGRRVYHMPFSRSVRISSSQAQILANHCQECATTGGVLLVQPEHILSFQLMVIELGTRPNGGTGKIIMDTQKFFLNKARDIVDESDENFSPKFELIYTMGSQRLIEHSPERWIVIQEILTLVAKYAPVAKQGMPKDIELEPQLRGSFPRTRFLSERASQETLSMVTDEICEKGLHGLPISRQPPVIRKALRAYLLEPKPDSRTILQVESSELWQVTSQNILLIRGLIGKGILAFAFAQKRWRVNYGLDFNRRPETRLAIPYRAKDNPSPRSEFSHPDVVICLTCLSYYYGGLEIESMKTAFNHLLGSDQAEVEYQDWVKTSDNLPSSFRNIRGVNLRDKEQFRDQVFPCFRYSKGAIDYYLAHIVFPKEMKEFPYKISASGWDLGRKGGSPVTGFSGTKDSQHVLPLDVKQLDLPSQRHTNAMVLETLTGPENLVVSLSDQKINGPCNADQLLSLLVGLKREVRVILDVGAQILELTNVELAGAWLGLNNDKERTQAVIFCNDNDELCVLDRDGHIELLNVSPFVKRLEACLVFLDEAHTRGIDLKLPHNYRAAVTLGANLSKDRLVQACMRLRRLGFGQSVTFCVPREIEVKIRALRDYPGEQQLSVSDVLAWSIHETWNELRRLIPIWRTQGITFARQQALWDKAMEQKKIQMDKDIAEGFLDNEAQTLDARYRPSNISAEKGLELQEDYIFRGITERCLEFSDLDTSSGSLQEEQERELAPEIEEERQLERAPPAKPEKHRLHPDLVKYVRTGELTVRPMQSLTAFVWAFESLAKSSAAKELEVSAFPQGLLVTRDFTSTVQSDSSLGECPDVFLREVQWVLTSRTSSSEMHHMVLLSPFEANQLVPEIEKSKHVVLSLYSPRQNSLFQPLDHLSICTVPSHEISPRLPSRLTIELNIFSGQLYFQTYQEYTEVCDFLCLAHRAAEEGVTVHLDGFIAAHSHKPQRCPSTIFQKSPVKFLRILMETVRRHGNGIGKTHMGKVFDGRLLSEDDFEI